MNVSDRIRPWASWIIAALVLIPSAAQPVGYQCLDTEFTILESTIDRTLARVDIDPFASQLPYFTIGLPSPERPEVWILELDGVAVDPPVNSPFAVGLGVLPSRARDLYVFDFQVNRLLTTIRGTLGRPEVTTAVVEIRHPAPDAMRSRLSEQNALARRGMERDLDPALEALAGAMSNTRGARDMIRAAAPGEITGGIVDVFALSPRWLRVEVIEGGLHRIDYALLRGALGDDADLIDPSSLRLFGARHRMQPENPEDPTGSWNAGAPLRERPLRVVAQGSSFGPGDLVEAYLPGVRGWSDEFDPSAATLRQEEQQTADRVAYWLTWDEVGGLASDFGGAPLRLATRGATPTGSPDRTLTDVRTRSHFEENLFAAFGLIEDDWAWRERILQNESARFDLGFEHVVTDSVSWMRTRPRVNAPTDDAADADPFRAVYTLNGNLVQVAEWTYGEQSDQRGENIPVVLTPVPLEEGANEIRVLNSTSVPGPRLVVDAFSFTWRRALRPGTDAVDWFVPSAEASSGRWRYEMVDPAGRLSTARVFDVTDAWNPVELTGLLVNGDGTTGAFVVDVVDGQTRRFVLALEDQFLAPVAFERRRPRLLRAEVANEDGTPAVGWQMVVLHPEIFEDAADDLAQLRRETLGTSRVTAVELQDVYDQFGHGTKDPAAIRNYFKFLYEVDRDFLYVLLVGDGNRDAKGVLPATDPDFCPTFIQEFWPLEGPQNWAYSSVPYGRDDWFVAFHAEPNKPNNVYGRAMDLTDAALGRLPVTTVSEASRVVQRLRDYEQDPTPGPWRNRVLLAADDLFGQASGRTNEDEHIAEAECVAENVLPRALDVDKVYLTEFDRTTPSSPNKPAGRAAFRNAWSEGALIVHYIGHGSPQQMADEVIFRIEDVPTLSNRGRLPLFLAFSCDVSIYDDPTTRSMSEQMVLQDEGGAIASIAAAQVTFSRLNEQLTEAFYTQLYPDAGTDDRLPAQRLSASEPIGVALMAAKWTAPQQQLSTSGNNNNFKYVLLGDPTMRLRSPEESVALQGTLAESFRAGRQLDLTAPFPGGESGGRWYVEARESARTVRVPYTYFTPNDTVLVYQLDGASFFDGNGDVGAAQLELPIRTPAVMRFGDRGRLRVLLESGAQQYVGVIDTLDVIRAPIDSDDAVGPEITLDFAQQARRVQPGSVLVATIEDASGINTLGTTPANSILYEIAEVGLSVDVTESFALDEGSTTRGSVEVPLSDVEPGNYTLRMTASDMLGNNSAAEIVFEVVPGGVAEIGNHAPVPNPVRSSTQFVVDVVSPSGLPSALEIDIRAVDGSPVRTLRADVGGGGGRVVVPWDGRDGRGDDIANGTYLYVVRARFATEPPVTETSTGRVVIMR